MEDPETWDLLTASLAGCNLQKPSLVWAILVLQGLVRDELADQVAFARYIREKQDGGLDTGPSVASRVAGALITAGIALPPSLVADPCGELAARRLQAVADWTGGGLTGDQVSDLKSFKEARVRYQAEHGESVTWRPPNLPPKADKKPW
jgi:hypothetical protein